MTKPTSSITLVLSLIYILLYISYILHLLRDTYCRQEPRLVLLYLAFVNFYTALYFRRRLLRLRNRHGTTLILLRRGLGYSAIFLGAVLLALFFYSFAQAGITLPQAAVVGLVIAVAAYFFYRVIVLHLVDDEEQEMHVEICSRPPI